MKKYVTLLLLIFVIGCDVAEKEFKELLPVEKGFKKSVSISDEVAVKDSRAVKGAEICRRNLKTIQKAKRLWAVDTGATENTTPTEMDLIVNYLRAMPMCPMEGDYTLGRAGSYPKCSIGDNNTPSASDDHILRD